MDVSFIEVLSKKATWLIKIIFILSLVGTASARNSTAIARYEYFNVGGEDALQEKVVSPKAEWGIHSPKTTTSLAGDVGMVGSSVFQDLGSLSTSPATLIQTIDVSAYDPPSPDTAGIAYIYHSNSLLFSDSELNEMPIFTGDNLFEIETNGTLITTTTTTDFTTEPTGVAYNPDNEHVFISNDDGKKVYEVNAGPDSLYGTVDDIVTSFKTSAFGATDPEGITYNAVQSKLYIAEGIFMADGPNDEFQSEVFEVSPGANGIFDGVQPAGDDQVSHFDTASWGITDPEGITSDPVSGNLYVIGKPGNHLAEFRTDGVLVRLFDISAANAVRPAGLGYGPSSQDPDQMSVYITDRGIDNNSDPNENDGKIYEMSLPPVAPGYSIPVVEAGDDLIVTFPEEASLAGEILDDGIPSAPTAVDVTWSKVSGPGSVAFADPNNEITTVTFSTFGEFILRLRANNGELIGADDLKVTVNPPPNEPPFVDAGSDQVVTLPDSGILDGTVSDDGLPDPPSSFTTVWSLFDGPVGGDVTFGDDNQVDTTANFSTAGTYTLRLTADDSELDASDDVVIIVNQPQNTPPTVEAGGDQTIFLPKKANLVGSVMDDGYPDPPGTVTITWSKSSGPGPVDFENAGQSETTATFSKEGVYILRLTGHDGQFEVSDEVTITVNVGSQLWLPVMIK